MFVVNGPVTSENAIRVKLPSIAYISRSAWQGLIEEQMWSSDADSELFAPTIAVEVDNFGGLDLSSPSGRAMDYKLREYYFEARGVQLVWVIGPRNTMIEYTRQDGASEKDGDGVHRVETTHWRDLHGQAGKKTTRKDAPQAMSIDESARCELFLDPNKGDPVHRARRAARHSRTRTRIDNTAHDLLQQPAALAAALPRARLVAGAALGARAVAAAGAVRGGASGPAPLRAAATRHRLPARREPGAAARRRHRYGAARAAAGVPTWQKGVDSVSAVGEAARTLLSSACSFVHFSKRETLATAAAAGEDASSSQKAIRSKSQFIRDLKRYVLIYVTLVFHDCHENDAPLELRQLLTEKEAREFLSTDVQSLGENTWNRQRNVVGSANKLRAAVVELWLRRTVNRALQKQFLCAEQAVELNQIISTFPQMYTRVFNLSTVPIPFNYAQYLRFAVVAYMVLFSFAHVPAAEWYTPLWVFPCAVLVFALDNVASEIECPFGSDANDIDLEARILCIQDELKVILQAHFHSIGYSTEYFSAEDRMASLSSLLSVDMPKGKRSRASSIATSYTSSVAGSSKDSVVMVQHQKEQRSPSREKGRASPVGIQQQQQQQQHILLTMPSDVVASYGSCDANNGFVNAAKHEQKHIAV